MVDAWFDVAVAAAVVADDDEPVADAAVCAVPHTAGERCARVAVEMQDLSDSS